MNSTSYRRLYNIATTVLLAQVASTWLQRLWAAWRKPIAFDDAYMFARYAANIRHGFGFVWNPGGPHTYGPTSLLWQAVVLVMSVVPLATWKLLTLGSWICSAGAVVAVAWAVAANAQSAFMSSTWRVLPMVALPLTASTVYAGNQATGMETMLAAMLCALFVGLSISWDKGRTQAVPVAIAGLLLFLTRPDTGIVIVLFPLLLCLLRPDRPRWRSLLALLSVFGGGVILECAVCHAYFHTFVPLSFYMKSGHGYQGIRGLWHPELEMLFFLAGCELYLVVLVMLGRRTDWRIVSSCLIAAAVAFTYLCTVDQIMGYNARFYMPYVSLFVIPALLVVDRWISNSTGVKLEEWPGRTLLVRGSVAGLIMLCFLAATSQSVLGMVRRVEHSSYVVYAPADLDVAATTPLPQIDWSEGINAVSTLLVAPLPKGVTVAATEVGYLGSHAPQVNIIDMAGLNDTDIALHGFRMEAFLARKPDIIWFPQTNYTYDRGLLFSDASLRTQYDLYAGAAIYGLGIRKDSPFHDVIERQMQVFWKAEYPGYRMDDYLVSAVHWSRQQQRVSEQ